MLKKISKFMFVALIILIFSSCSITSKKFSYEPSKLFCEQIDKLSQIEQLKFYELLNDSSLYILYPSKITLGNFINIKIISPYDGYLYIFSQNSKGKINLLFPNKFKKDNFLKRNSEFNSVNDIFAFKAVEPAGVNHLIILFKKEKLNLDKNPINDINSLKKLLSQKFSKIEKAQFVKVLTINLITKKEISAKYE